MRALMVNTNEDTYKASVKANDVENENWLPQTCMSCSVVARGM